MTTEQHTELVDRYVALWNEPNADIRRKLIRELWAPDGAQVLVDPPEEIRSAAANLNFPMPSLEVHGYDALEARVTRGHEMFIATGEHVFERRGEVSQLLGHVVTFTWDMVTVASGEWAGSGADFFVLDADGRIRTDYQAVGTTPEPD